MNKGIVDNRQSNLTSSTIQIQAELPVFLNQHSKPLGFRFRDLVIDHNVTLKMPCPFEILGLPPSATMDQLQKARRKLALVNHPDRTGGSTESMKLINEAYEKAVKICEARGRTSKHDRGFGQSSSHGRRFSKTNRSNADFWEEDMDESWWRRGDSPPAPPRPGNFQSSRARHGYTPSQDADDQCDYDGRYERKYGAQGNKAYVSPEEEKLRKYVNRATDHEERLFDDYQDAKHEVERLTILLARAQKEADRRRGLWKEADADAQNAQAQWEASKAR